VQERDSVRADLNAGQKSRHAEAFIGVPQVKHGRGRQSELHLSSCLRPEWAPPVENEEFTDPIYSLEAQRALENALVQSSTYLQYSSRLGSLFRSDRRNDQAGSSRVELRIRRPENELVGILKLYLIMLDCGDIAKGTRAVKAKRVISRATRYS